MDERIIECVPNFSEGRDRNIINSIGETIRSVDGVKLLNVDAGAAANRTVYTFAGQPEAVVEAAFCAAKVAIQLIDMRHHHGEHPRIGVVDVLPLVPIRGVTLEECAVMARRLAQRMADELAIPCYCYDAAALRPEHRKLENCRRGEYEGIASKLSNPMTAPDYGSRPYDDAMARTGCSVVGARKYLIAVNFNLNSKSVHIAKAIAGDIRESGCGGHPGTLKCVKAIGWYIEEYGVAQVSMNLTDIDITPLHVAFEEVCRSARQHGVMVTGTEIIGMVPERVLVDAGRYFHLKSGDNNMPSSDTLIAEAINSFNLSEISPFKPEERLIERLI